LTEKIAVAFATNELPATQLPIVFAHAEPDECAKIQIPRSLSESRAVKYATAASVLSATGLRTSNSAQSTAWNNFSPRATSNLPILPVVRLLADLGLAFAMSIKFAAMADLVSARSSRAAKSLVSAT
jgi:hypothetical protein